MCKKLSFCARILLICGALFFLVIMVSSCAVRRPKPLPTPVYVPPPVVEHVVTYRGETLGLIAYWYTGQTTNWQLIVDVNPGLRPEAMRIGDVIVIPGELITKRERLPENVVRGFSKKVRTVTPKELEAEKSDSKEVVRSDIFQPEEVADEGMTGEGAAAKVGGDASREVAETEDDAVAQVVGETEQPSDTSNDDLEREKLLEELLGQ